MLNPASDRSFTSGLLCVMVREIMFRWYRIGATVAGQKLPKHSGFLELFPASIAVRLPWSTWCEGVPECKADHGAGHGAFELVCHLVY